ncbi:hypothetical protein [Methyloversatilis sp. XJ19-49]|uniref:hypothetical protein n=1 Tax=Methyloversatilis sp. XJ19-49 TaxID=2963429 RepID=UPI00211CC202|nr:hypothetical protein [Methyloversatilis sp. XJ19-49]MCQ9378579.1 hypothetical protein [Methyloversatilis sp. XJ19-49]
MPDIQVSVPPSPSATVIHDGIVFPLSVLHVLLAQGAAAEVRRRYEGEGDVFATILENRAFQEEFIASYLEANRVFFTAIKSCLPATCRSILDIGCGIGLIDLLLYRCCGAEKPVIYLFDKSVDLSSIQTAPTGFNQTYVFTASLEVTAEFLALNGVAPGDLRLCEVGNWSIAACRPVDFVFSRKSWGFHYPVSEYVDDVADSLSDDGVVVTDVRLGQGGERLLLERFTDVRPLQEAAKSALMLARHPRPRAS